MLIEPLPRELEGPKPIGPATVPGRHLQHPRLPVSTPSSKHPGYGRPRMRSLRHRLLGVTAVVLAALAAWVPVVTTIATSIAAYVAVARYDHLVIEYMRTAQRLQHLRQEHLDNPANDRPRSSTPAKPPSRSKTRLGWPVGTHPAKTHDKAGAGPPYEPAWVSRRLHTLEARMESWSPSPPHRSGTRLN
jgi:SMODS and SLOG-associating 2TM effector domain 1